MLENEVEGMVDPSKMKHLQMLYETEIQKMTKFKVETKAFHYVRESQIDNIYMQLSCLYNIPVADCVIYSRAKGLPGNESLWWVDINV